MRISTRGTAPNPKPALEGFWQCADQSLLVLSIGRKHKIGFLAEGCGMFSDMESPHVSSENCQAVGLRQGRMLSCSLLSRYTDWMLWRSRISESFSYGEMYVGIFDYLMRMSSSSSGAEGGGIDTKCAETGIRTGVDQSEAGRFRETLVVRYPPQWGRAESVKKSKNLGSMSDGERTWSSRPGTGSNARLDGSWGSELG